MTTIVLALMLLFQSTRAPNPALPASIEGVVLDVLTNRPLQGATITLRDRRTPSTLMETDSRDDGSFAFRAVPPGTYSIETSKPGYITELLGERPLESPDFTPPPIQQLAPGQQLTGVRVVLTPGAVLTGRVLDDTGSVVTGATVQALKTTFRNGLRERSAVQRTTTNDLGEYRLFMLAPGEYTVSVRDPALSGASPILNAGSPLYYPGTLDPLEAQLVTVRAGELRGGLDFPSIPTRTRRVAGVVQGLAYGEGAQVKLTPRNGTGSASTGVNPDGSFHFDNVIPGTYLLHAQTISSRTMVLLDIRSADVLNARLAFGSAFRIPTHVRIEGHAEGNDPALEDVYFRARPEPPIAGMVIDTYSPFADGNFTFELPGGDYRIDLTRTEDYYVKSMTVSGVEVLNADLHVENSSVAPLEILVASDTGSLEGRAEMRGVTVVLIPDVPRRGQRALFKSQQSGPSGEFRFAKVPPGDYKVFAWSEENGGPWLDPQYVARYESRGVPVRIPSSERIVLDRLVPANGRIEDSPR